MATKGVKFKYSLDQRVFTPFGEPAMVATQAVDAAGIVYFVQIQGGNGQWFKEALLTTEK